MEFMELILQQGVSMKEFFTVAKMEKIISRVSLKKFRYEIEPYLNENTVSYQFTFKNVYDKL